MPPYVFSVGFNKLYAWGSYKVGRIMEKSVGGRVFSRGELNLDFL